VRQVGPLLVWSAAVAAAAAAAAAGGGVAVCRQFDD